MSTSTDRVKKYNLIEELKAARNGSRSTSDRDNTASQTREPSTKAKGRKKNRFGRKMGKRTLKGGNI